MIALIYKDYLCDEQERQEYLNTVSRIMGEIEEEKRELYNPNNIFKNRVQEKVEEPKAHNLLVDFSYINDFIAKNYGR